MKECLGQSLWKLPLCGSKPAVFHDTLRDSASNMFFWAQQCVEVLQCYIKKLNKRGLEPHKYERGTSNATISPRITKHKIWF